MQHRSIGRPLTAREGADPQSKRVASGRALLEQNRHCYPPVCTYGWRALSRSINGCGDFKMLFVPVVLARTIGTLTGLSAGVAGEGHSRWRRFLPRGAQFGSAKSGPNSLAFPQTVRYDVKLAQYFCSPPLHEELGSYRFPGCVDWSAHILGRYTVFGTRSWLFFTTRALFAFHSKGTCVYIPLLSWL